MQNKNNNEVMSREEIMNAIAEGDRGIGVLLEDLEGKVQIGLEDHERLDRKIDGVDFTLEAFRQEANEKFDFLVSGQKHLLEENQLFFERFDGVSTQFQIIDSRFDGVNMQFKSIDERFDAIDTRFDNMDNRFDNMDKRFDQLEKLIIQGQR
jgi:predicted  nucleic acid-binding Zn-ribbon protein